MRVSFYSPSPLSPYSDERHKLSTSDELTGQQNKKKVKMNSR